MRRSRRCSPARSGPRREASKGGSQCSLDTHQPRNSLIAEDLHALRPDLHRQARQPALAQGEPPRSSRLSRKPRRDADLRRPLHRAGRADHERQPDRGRSRFARRRAQDRRRRSVRQGGRVRLASRSAPGCGPSTIPTRRSEREAARSAMAYWLLKSEPRPGPGTSRRRPAPKARSGRACATFRRATICAR